ncbi:Hsp20 family protein [Aerophototrophica crusticola]|uniref:Hsp20 family protein n=1 Tax=Aerophototrophica crusticola TaxID=1709002 RepID=A0A858R4K0_9PROT|nr:Hsp20 family protein [Rhodospirillaceae bacterium B3]
MRTYDLSPLFRSTVGFDRMTRLLETALSGEDNGNSYPPYNIEKLGDDQYRVTMAVAGFRPEDLEITAHPNLLVIQGKAKEQEGGTFLHRGIAGRAFERRFQLADHIRVNGAALENGLLHVELLREVPEAMKPRTIKINTGAPVAAPQIEAKAA